MNRILIKFIFFVCLSSALTAKAGKIHFYSCAASDSISFSAFAEFDTAKQYELQEIVIKEKSGLTNSNLSTSQQTINIQKSNLFNSKSVGEVFKQTSGVFVKSYGGEGSLQTISARGTGTEYSSVEMNGMDLTNTLGGSFDFSNYTADELSFITVNLGSDFSLIGANSSNGKIFLDPFNKNDSTKLNLNYTFGSFGLNSYSTQINQAMSNTNFGLAFYKKTAVNNYDYQFEGKTFLRENADLDQSIIKLTLTNDFEISNSFLLVKSLFRFSDKELGLPGFIASNKHERNNVRQFEKNKLFVTNLNWFFENGFTINGIIGLNATSIKISDPQAEVNLRSTQFQFTNHNLSFRLLTNYLGESYSIAAGLNSNFENFYFDESEIHQTKYSSLKRNYYNISAALNKQFVFSESSHKLGINLMLNNTFVNSIYSKDQESSSILNYKLGVGYSPFAENLVRLFANYSFGVRILNFYELYYSKMNFLSNPNLKNETIYDFECGVGVNSSFINADFIFFNRFVKDKIVWYANRIAVFTPRNAGKVTADGFEVRISDFKFTNFISARSNYTFTNVYNTEKLGESDQAYKKQLVYIPKHAANFIFSMHLEEFNFEFVLNYFSERFYSEDNDPDYVLSEPLLLDLALSYSIWLYDLKTTLLLNVNNLINENYFLIQSYPMPGRDFRLSLKTEI